MEAVSRLEVETTSTRANQTTQEEESSAATPSTQTKSIPPIEMEEEGSEGMSPKGYFLKALLGRGVKTGSVAFNNPKSGVTCVALKYRTEDELPQMYDKELLNTLYDASLTEVSDRVEEGGKDKAKLLANAQNPTGETLLMKICRRSLTATPKSKDRGLQVVSLLLRAGANPMTCCDSGRNVLHDVFWTAKPPPEEVLKAMETMVDMLREYTGKNGILELMLSEDKHGFTPLDYVVPSQQPNWRSIVDTVVAWATEEASTITAAQQRTLPVGSGSPGADVPSADADARASGPAPAAAEERPLPGGSDDAERAPSSRGSSPGSASRVLELETLDRHVISRVVEDMCPDDRRLIAQLCSASASFLLSDTEDPDAIIVACSPSFVRETGYSADEVLGRNCRFLQGPGTSTSQVDLIRKALAQTASVRVSLLNYRKDGSLFLNNFLLTPLRRIDGKTSYYIGIQNCSPTVVEDRRKRLAAAGHAWLDDDPDFPAQNIVDAFLLPNARAPSQLPPQLPPPVAGRRLGVANRAVSAETLTEFSQVAQTADQGTMTENADIPAPKRNLSSSSMGSNASSSSRGSKRAKRSRSERSSRRHSAEPPPSRLGSGCVIS